MKSAIESKLQALVDYHQELAQTLSDPETLADHERFRELSKEYAQLEPLVETYREYEAIKTQIHSTRSILDQENDPNMRELAEEELTTLEEKQTKLEHQLQLLMLPSDPHENANAFLEIRAGTGGAEAAIFVGDLLRMYSRYAEQKGWRFQIWSAHEGDYGGYKEVIVKISGKGVYGTLKFESGTHRVQRVPETESQGRIHTSACTVAVLPEPEEIEAIEIDPSEIRVDTFRAQGAGGQHVNTTDSAVRITHLPTDTVVECQEERSQFKNRAKALSLLQAKLLEAQRLEQKRQQEAERRSLVGTGDRSQRIRTYNFPQGRVTDHRINLTLYQLEQILEGDLEPIIQGLQQEEQVRQLSELSAEDDADS